jgi:hypothetical protein
VSAGATRERHVSVSAHVSESAIFQCRSVRFKCHVSTNNNSAIFSCIKLAGLVNARVSMCVLHNYSYTNSRDLINICINIMPAEDVRSSLRLQNKNMAAARNPHLTFDMMAIIN